MPSHRYLSMRELGAKRLFDLIVVSLAAVCWLPVLCLCGALILFFDGAPVFYKSQRRTGAGTNTVWKFRTMVKNAAELCNRGNTRIEREVRFLNIDSSSPLYTGVGRLIERATLTEIPQLFHVLTGKMTLVGNRPLPEDVVAALSKAYSNVEARFLTPAGLTGPAQLAGRDSLTDRQRLRLEAIYCTVASQDLVWRLDFMILLYTVLTSLHLKAPMSYDNVQEFMLNLSRPGTTHAEIEELPRSSSEG